MREDLAVSSRAQDVVGISAQSLQRNARLTRYFDQWLLDHRNQSPDYILYARTAKIMEESGEVMQAVIGYLGDNPRKGVTHSLKDVQTELADVIVTALCALEHTTMDPVETAHIVNERFRFIETRLATREDYRASAFPAE